MGGRRAGVRREEGDVERVVLWYFLVGDERSAWRRRGTCLPIMPIQAIDGVDMVGTVGIGGASGSEISA